MNASNVLTIQNDNQNILHTNYWGSPLEAAGMFVASVNAGALRILTPTCHRQAFLREAATAKEVIVSRGFWPIAGDDGIEILFDDHSETPYALHIVGAACRPMISRSEDGKCVKVSLWSLRNGRIQLEAEFNGRFRVTPRIPWGRRW